VGSAGPGGNGSGGAGGASSSGGTGAFSGVGGSAPDPCLPPDAGSLSPMCGPSSTCQILVDEILPVPPGYRNDAPALALGSGCAPIVLFSLAENAKYEGFLGVRTAPASWLVSPTPFPLATAGIAVKEAGLLAFPNDGAFGAGLWAFVGDQWHSVGAMPAMATHMARGFTQANNGVLYTAFKTDIDELFLGTFDDGWTLSKLGQTPTPPPVAVSPEGQPHVVAWEPSAGAWALHWYAAPSAPEIVLPITGQLLAEVQRPALAVTAADAGNPQGKPHVLGLRALPDFTAELVYATRTGKDAWSVVSLEKPEPGIRYTPLGIVTDETGDVRLFYGRGAVTLEPAQARVVVAWPSGGAGPGKAVVLEGIDALGATFQRDGLGNVHAAMYTVAEFTQFDVRYTVFGP
jgi:hypothetical protein